jgi:hydroxyacylglutathione hydrolase
MIMADLHGANDNSLGRELGRSAWARTACSGFLVIATLLAAFRPLRGQERPALEAAWKQLVSAEPYFSRGLKEFGAHRYPEASAAFQKCVEEMQRHAYAQYYLANILYIEGDYEKALASMEGSLRDLPFMQKLNDYAVERKKRKIDSYQQMLGAEWENTNSCRTSREIESLAGELTDRKSKLELEAEKRHLALSMQEAHYRYFLGNILFQLKRLDEAGQKYREAIELNPRHASAYNNAAAVSFLSGDAPKALEILERAEKQGLEDNLNLELRRRVLQALGRPTEGILQEDLSQQTNGDLGVMRFALAFKSENALMPPLYVNCYVVYSRTSRRAVLIDPGVADPRIADFVAKRDLEVVAILNTHGHPDHAAADAYYARRYGAPVLVHRRDAGSLAHPPDRRLGGSESLRFDGLAVDVIHTPGHTPGSVCFGIGDFLFSGDTLFKNDIGRISSDDPASARAAQEKLVRRIKETILTLPDRILVCPGHGRTSTIAAEKAENPFLKK